MSCFSLYLFSLFSYKVREQGCRTKSFPEGRAVASGKGHELEKGVKRMNMVQNMCIHVSKGKNDSS
jgi:hypothetical protein